MRLDFGCCCWHAAGNTASLSLLEAFTRSVPSVTSVLRCLSWLAAILWKNTDGDGQKTECGVTAVKHRLNELPRSRQSAQWVPKLV